jgi:hypothetical protein
MSFMVVFRAYFQKTKTKKRRQTSLWNEVQYDWLVDIKFIVS